MTCHHCGADLSGRLSKNRKFCNSRCRDWHKPRVKQRVREAIAAAKTDKRKRYLAQCAATGGWL